jgi:hypothetical protein
MLENSLTYNMISSFTTYILIMLLELMFVTNIYALSVGVKILIGKKTSQVSSQTAKILKSMVDF